MDGAFYSSISISSDRVICLTTTIEGGIVSLRRTTEKEVEKMKRIAILFLLLLTVSAGCAQTVRVQGVEGIESVPKLTYVIFFYSSGTADRLRAVFLKNPGSDVEVVADSVQIVMTRGTGEDAMALMQRGIHEYIDVQSVSYKGNIIGYLLTQRMFYGPFARDTIEVNLYERGGKLHFSVREKRYDSG